MVLRTHYINLSTAPLHDIDSSGVAFSSVPFPLIQFLECLKAISSICPQLAISAFCFATVVKVLTDAVPPAPWLDAEPIRWWWRGLITRAKRFFGGSDATMALDRLGRTPRS